MASPLPIDPYEVLNVPRDADISAIRSAHRKLAFKHHPDRIKDEAERQKGTEEFQKAQQAYELLSDEKRRARYDDQIRLISLRKEAMMERGGPVRSTTYPVPHAMPHPAPPPRTGPSTTYEYRGGRMYEERRPKHYSDEDDRYTDITAKPSSRKASGHEKRPSTSYGDEKKKKSSGLSGFMESALRDAGRRARDKVAHAESAKSRDKERRQDTTNKYSSRHAYVSDDDDSDSDSDTVTYVPRKPEPKRRTTYHESPKKSSKPSKEKESRRSSGRDTASSDTDEWDTRDNWAHRHEEAMSYIVDRSGTSRPSILRSDAAHYISPREPSNGRKSGSDREERREERSRPSNPRPHIEVVEPPRRSPQSRKEKPPMPTSKSSPAEIKIPTTSHRDAPQPHRSSTGDYPREHRREMPSMSRSSTMPVPSMSSRKDAAPTRSSKLKHAETHDSGYGSSSPATPEHHGTSPPKSTKYFIVDEDKEHGRGHRTVPIDDDDYRPRRTRSPSPPRDKDRSDRKHRPERPTVSTNGSSAKPSRSASYAMSPDQMSPRPNMFRNESSRSAMPRDSPPLARGDSSRHLYGEIPKEESYRVSPENVRYSPKITPHDVKYTPGRRGSAEVRDRDYFPGSTHHNDLHSSKRGSRDYVYT